MVTTDPGIWSPRWASQSVCGLTLGGWCRRSSKEGDVRGKEYPNETLVLELFPVD